MMRLYLDSNFPKSVFNVIVGLQQIQFPQKYEIVRGRWSEHYRTEDTAVFLINLNAKGTNPVIDLHLRDGYKVIAYRKPVNESFDPYECALTLLGYWRRILTDIEQNEDVVLVTFRSKGKYRLIKHKNDSTSESL